MAKWDIGELKAELEGYNEDIPVVIDDTRVGDRQEIVANFIFDEREINGVLTIILVPIRG